MKDKTIEELHEMIEQYQILENNFRVLMNAEHAKANEVRIELQKRDKWNAKVVIESMLNQLNEYVDELSIESFTILKNSLNRTLTKSGFGSKNIYVRGGIVDYINFELHRLIISKAKKNNIVVAKSHKTNGKFNIRFKFNKKEDKIIRGHVSTLFASGVGYSYKYVVDSKELLVLNRKIMSHVELEYNDYNNIIPSMVNVMKFIDNELDAIFLAHYLSK